MMLSSNVNAQPKLWGTLPYGGNTESGVVYEIGLDGNDLNVIHDFPMFNGERPRGKLLYADNGKLYGLTSDGGSFGNGVLFEYDPLADEYLVIHDFQVYKDRPRYGAFLEVESDFGIGENDHGQLQLSIYPNPVNDVLTIKIDQQHSTLLSIRILNQLGQLMLDCNAEVDASTTIDLDVHDLDTGVYFISCFDDHGQAYSGKFVKAE